MSRNMSIVLIFCIFVLAPLTQTALGKQHNGYKGVVWGTSPEKATNKLPSSGQDGCEAKLQGIFWEYLDEKLEALPGKEGRLAMSENYAERPLGDGCGHFYKRKYMGELLTFDEAKQVGSQDIIKLFDQRYGQHYKSKINVLERYGNDGNFFLYYRWTTKQSHVYLLVNIWKIMGIATERMVVFYSSKRWANAARKDQQAEIKQANKKVEQNRKAAAGKALKKL